MKKAVLTIANIYTLLLMAAFPLVITDAYYNIQETKLYFFLYSTIAAVGLVLLVILGGKLLGLSWDAGSDPGKDSAGSGSKAGAGKKSISGKDSKKLSFENLRKYMLPADWFALLFITVVILSTVCSEWKYEAFWGNMGRQQGCFLWIWYFAAYVLISRFYRLKHWHTDLFLAAGLIVCIWGVLDCFWMSPIGWQIAHESNEKSLDFSSTIGNVNILTALEGMYLMAASAMFIGSECADGSKPEELPAVSDTAKGSKKLLYMLRQAFYYFTACAAFMGLVCGCSDNALISAAAAVCFLPFLAFRSLKSIVRYAGLLAGYLVTMLLTGIIGHREGQKVVIRWKWGKLLEISMEHPDAVRKMFPAALILLAVLLTVWFISERNNKQKASSAADGPWKGTKPLRILWAALGVLAVCAVIWVFYDANHGGHPELYKPYKSVLIFNDAWGTHRGYNWRLAMKYFKDFPLYKKLIGSGPETYGIYTHVYDHYAMLDMFDETYDSPHNEWLQYLFTTGILGFIGYYGLVKSALWSGFGLSRKNADVTAPGSMDGKTVPTVQNTPGTAICAVAFAYALQVYTLQSFVNISIPVILPIVIMCIGICVGAGRPQQP